MYYNSNMTQIEFKQLIKEANYFTKYEAIIEREGIEKGKINVSFLVKGHWRNQSYINSESKERYNKLKWIDSYFKGKDKDKLQKIIEI